MALVLVAEDNPDHRRVIAEIVRRLGHDTVVAGDGAVALLAAGRRRPDLVLADIDMPRMTGVQLCRALQDDPALADVPVVLITALSPRDGLDLIGCAAATVLRKPFDLGELSAVITDRLAAAPQRAAQDGFAAWPSDPEFPAAMLRSVDTGLAACDSAGRIIFFNDNLGEFFGAGSAGVPIAQWAQRIPLRHHDGRPLLSDELPMMRALTGETVRRAGLLATDQQGRPRWLTVNARPVRDGRGAIVGAVAAVEDVTASWQARVYESCKTAVLESLTSGPSAQAARQAAVEAVGACLRWPYVRLWLSDPVTGQIRTDATWTAPGEEPPPIPNAFAPGEGLAGQCWERGELIWVPDIHADDSPVLPEVRAGTRFRAAGAVPVRAGKQVTGVMTFFSHDPQEPEPGLAVLLTGIADNIGAHLQQHRADDLARHLAAIIDEYVALAGHELRTPLTSIAAYSELIAETPDLDPDVRDMVEVVRRNGRHLRHVIDQLLDLAALDAGHHTLAEDDVDLTLITAEAVEGMREVAAGRRVSIVTRATASARVRGDAGRLRQMVRNLLDNAVKFSPEDATVTVELTKQDGAVLLAVTDNGIGLPGDHTTDLFRRLYRGDNARHTGILGNGLGLALCRTIVELHHGTIALRANEPRGTTAAVRLPAPS